MGATTQFNKHIGQLVADPNRGTHDRDTVTDILTIKAEKLGLEFAFAKKASLNEINQAHNPPIGQSADKTLTVIAHIEPYHTAWKITDFDFSKI